MAYSFRIYVDNEEISHEEVLERLVKDCFIKTSEVVFLNESGRVFEINGVNWDEAYEISQCIRNWFKNKFYLSMEDNRFIVEI